jgi:hypothetical protein
LRYVDWGVVEGVYSSEISLSDFMQYGPGIKVML